MNHVSSISRHDTQNRNVTLNGSYTTCTLDRPHVTATLLLLVRGSRIRTLTDGAAILAGGFRGFPRILQANTGLGEYFLFDHDGHISHLL
jgi:hypothetical protein